MPRGAPVFPCERFHFASLSPQLLGVIPNLIAAMERLLDEGFQPKHVDRKALYVNFEERIKYLHDFLEFGIGKTLLSGRSESQH
jgi:hypothetical protein